MKESDINLVVDYFINAEPGFLKGMGADKNKLPERSEWITKLTEDLYEPIKEKQFYYVIWQIEDEPFGHSNINRIKYGKNATMHLHIWSRNRRQSGIGLKLLQQTIPYYFENFELEKLICEPYALNPAPTKVLQKVGFEFVRAYDTTPGVICFYQTVNRYEMSRDRFYEINNTDGT